VRQHTLLTLSKNDDNESVFAIVVVLDVPLLFIAVSMMFGLTRSVCRTLD
jgi:hypothetical protein